MVSCYSRFWTEGQIVCEDGSEKDFQLLDFKEVIQGALCCDHMV